MKQSKKSEYLQLRLSKLEKKLIKESAQTQGLDMSAWILDKVLNHKSIEYNEILEQFDKQQQSFVFAAINDFFSGLNRIDFQQVTAYKPPANLNEFQINYTIAMVLQRANQLSSPYPDWISNYPTPEKPYFGSNLKSLRLYLLVSSPVEFKSRNIFIDSAIGDRV